MAKAKPKSRVIKPPPVAADDFVTGGTSKRSATKTPRRSRSGGGDGGDPITEPQGGGDGGVGTPFGKAVVERADGKTLRRMTVYLPPELAKRLKLAGIEHERDMSDIITEAVGSWLDANG